jgi:hypothetical protein
MEYVSIAYRRLEIVSILVVITFLAGLTPCSYDITSRIMVSLMSVIEFVPEADIYQVQLESIGVVLK